MLSSVVTLVPCHDGFLYPPLKKAARLCSLNSGTPPHPTPHHATPPPPIAGLKLHMSKLVVKLPTCAQASPPPNIRSHSKGSQQSCASGGTIANNVIPSPRNTSRGCQVPPKSPLLFLKAPKRRPLIGLTSRYQALLGLGGPIAGL